MSETSTIEWTDSTWNPVRGCTKLSPGCKNCYANTFAERFRGVMGHPFEFGFDLRLVPEKLTDPLRWAKPKRVFVNSMSDLFHEDISENYIAAVAKVMVMANWHDFQVLTKRSARMRKVLSGSLEFAAGQEHILWGVSVEDRKYGLPRIADLQWADVKHRFLSVEPLLEDLGIVSLDGIDWVIVGGESGPGARPIQKEWVTSLRDQCEAGGIPFFFKQWGGIRKKAAGSDLEGVNHKAFPEVLRQSVPRFIKRRAMIAQFEQNPILTKDSVAA